MVGQCFPEREDFAQWRDYAIGLSSAFKWNRGCLPPSSQVWKKKKWKIRGVTGPDQSATSFLAVNGSKEERSHRCMQERIYDLFHLLSFLPKGSATSGTESREVCKLAQVASLD